MKQVERCLYCYESLPENLVDYHPGCSQKIFGKPEAPMLDFNKSQLLELGKKIIERQAGIAGVQPKLSLGLDKKHRGHKPQKLTIMGVWGHYILKPPSDHFECLPELEDLSMHLASLAGIQTVPHTLVRLKSGELSYLTRRIDRQESRKIHMEDMCQLTERLTEAKYRGSYEQVAKAVVKFSSNPGLDLIRFFEQLIFCFLTGNNDMHLKNFSIIRDPKLGHILSPAYDLIAATLVVEEDNEELALTLNGKKRKLKRRDFEQVMGLFQLHPRVFENVFLRLKKHLQPWLNFIEISFLPPHLKTSYQEMILQRAHQLQL